MPQPQHKGAEVQFVVAYKLATESKIFGSSSRPDSTPPLSLFTSDQALLESLLKDSNPSPSLNAFLASSRPFASTILKHHPQTGWNFFHPTSATVALQPLPLHFLLSKSCPRTSLHSSSKQLRQIQRPRYRFAVSERSHRQGSKRPSSCWMRDVDTRGRQEWQ